MHSFNKCKMYTNNTVINYIIQICLFYKLHEKSIVYVYLLKFPIHRKTGKVMDATYLYNIVIPSDSAYYMNTKYNRQ